MNFFNTVVNVLLSHLHSVQLNANDLASCFYPCVVVITERVEFISNLTLQMGLAVITVMNA
jgi:predicted nucleotide-binding protein (sugar kinase/HSP70/actin superfamily)